MNSGQPNLLLIMADVTGEDPRPVRHSAFSGSSGMWNMVETPRWKLVRHTVDAVAAAPREELFDLEADPAELVNRVDDPACREALLDLRERLLRVLETTPPCQMTHRWSGPA